MSGLTSVFSTCTPGPNNGWEQSTQPPNPRTWEKDAYHPKSFVLIVLLPTNADDPSSPSFLGFVIENVRHLFGLDFISGEQ